MRKWFLLLFVLSLTASLTLAQTTTPTPTPVGTLGAPEIGATPIVIEPLLGLPIQPPVAFELPEDWLYGYDVIVYNDIDGLTDSVPFALYTGPVTGGTGTIILVWGFDSVTTGIQFDPSFGVTNSWLDGLRILRTIIFDPLCNIGTAPQRNYSVGELPATGTTFNIIDCPEGQPDTRGWFAAMQLEGVNLAFYVYIDPLQPAGSLAEQDLQDILDTAVFSIEEMLISREAYQATQQAIITLTPEATATEGGE